MNKTKLEEIQQSFLLFRSIAGYQQMSGAEEADIMNEFIEYCSSLNRNISINNKTLYFIKKTIIKRSIVKDSSNIKVTRKINTADYIIFSSMGKANKYYIGYKDIRYALDLINLMIEHGSEKFISNTNLMYIISPKDVMTYPQFLFFKEKLVETRDAGIRNLILEEISNYDVHKSILYMIDLYKTSGINPLTDKTKLLFQTLRNDYYSLIQLVSNRNNFNLDKIYDACAALNIEDHFIEYLSGAFKNKFLITPNPDFKDTVPVEVIIQDDPEQLAWII